VRLLANISGEDHTLEVDEDRDSGLLRVKVDDREYLVDATNPAPGLYSLVVRGQTFNAYVSPQRGNREVQVGPWRVNVELASAQSRRPAAKSAATVGGRQEIIAPMSGRVVQVLVRPGQTVQPGESLVIIEAMKMETEIRAVGRGQVSEIQVDANMAVEAGQVLLVVEGS
jgi:oxaloacetate decarboxylase (Na+ extruding) subunit alpha